MKPKPKASSESSTSYPSRRDFIQRFGAVAAGVAAGALAARGGERLGGKPRIAGGMRAPIKKKPFCAETCGKEIDAQIKLLSNKDFKVRKQASAKLVAMGKAEGEEKKVADQKKALVLAKMEKLKTSKDPEIAQRAKAIILAVNPPKKPIVKDPPILMGKIKTH